MNTVFLLRQPSNTDDRCMAPPDLFCSDEEALEGSPLKESLPSNLISKKNGCLIERMGGRFPINFMDSSIVECVRSSLCPEQKKAADYVRSIALNRSTRRMVGPDNQRDVDRSLSPTAAT